MCSGSNDADITKEVPFVGFMCMKIHLGVAAHQNVEPPGQRGLWLAIQIKSGRTYRRDWHIHCHVPWVNRVQVHVSDIQPISTRSCCVIPAVSRMLRLCTHKLLAIQCIV